MKDLMKYCRFSLVEFSTKSIHNICFQTWCKLNKITCRLFAPNNLVLTTIFFGAKTQQVHLSSFYTHLLWRCS